MNRGKGYSWFKVILVDEPKNYVQLEGHIEEKHDLIGNMSFISALIGKLEQQQLEGRIEEQQLIGLIHNQHFMGVLGGEKDE